MKRDIIGRIEKITFIKPSLIATAKIDTGATYCVLHVDEIINEGNCLILRFKKGTFFPHLEKNIRYIVHRFQIRKIKTSEGRASQRYVITLKFNLGTHPLPFQARFALTDRSSMEHPVLLGLNFLQEYGFLVDPSSSFLMGRK